MIGTRGLWLLGTLVAVVLGSSGAPPTLPGSDAAALAQGRIELVAGFATRGNPPSDDSLQVLRMDELYASYGAVLNAFVDDQGLVDYAALAAGRGRAGLESFMEKIADVDVGQLPSDPARIAFWSNAYNATVISQVVDRYPLDSVRDVGSLFGGGFFKIKHRIAGAQRHLDNIEHDILRKNFDDPRIHFVLVCGAFGCPRLLPRPYRAADLEDTLAAQAREFLAQPRGLRIDRDRNTLYLSRYFDWYGKDFKASAGSVIDYILPYAPPASAAYIRSNRRSLRRRFMDYDWALNDQAKGPREHRRREQG